MTRREFKLHHKLCMACGCIGCDLHHIARGADKVDDPCVFLILCRPCHDEMDDYSIWPISRQLALKRRADPDNYDRVRFNQLRRRDPEAITEEDVNKEDLDG
jgi:hypothetical protein